MPKRSGTKKPTKRAARELSTDPNVAAFQIVQEIIEKAESEGKDPLAVALGRRGGLKGGRARADKLTPKQLSESARKAARARWQRKPQR